MGNILNVVEYRWKAKIDTFENGVVCTLKATPSDGNYKMVDIIFGEVWVAMGQSNMQYRLGKAQKYHELVQKLRGKRSLSTKRN